MQTTMYRFSDSERSILEKIPVPLCIFQIIDGRICLLLASEGTCRIIGMDRDRFMSSFVSAVHDRIHPEDHGLIREAAVKAISNPEHEYCINYRIMTEDNHYAAIACTTVMKHLNDEICLLYSYYMRPDLQETTESVFEREQLKSENERLRRIIDNVPSGMAACILNEERFETVIMNDYLLRTLNVTKRKSGELTYNDFVNYIYPADKAWCKRIFDEFIFHGGKLDGVCRIIHGKKGKYVWVHIEGKLIERPDKRRVAYIACTDVTSLKEAEAELLQKRRAYEEAVRVSHLIMWEYDIAERRIIMSDDKATREIVDQNGWPAVIENVPFSVMDRVESNDIHKVLDMYDNVHRGNEVACDIWYREYQGHNHFCMHIDYTIEKDSQGNAVKAYGIGKIITEQKKAEERYSEELQNMRDKVERNLIAKSQSSLTHNSLMTYSMRNLTAAELSENMLYDECVEKIAAMAVSKEESEKVRNFLDRKRLIHMYEEGRSSFELEYKRHNSAGECAWISFLIKVFRVPHTDEVECFIYTYDITEQIQNDIIMGMIADREFDFIGLLYVKSGMFEIVKKSNRLKSLKIKKKYSYRECMYHFCKKYIPENEKDQFDQATSLDEIVNGIRCNNRYTVTYKCIEARETRCKQTDYFSLDASAGIILVVRTDVTSTYEKDLKQIREIRDAKKEADRANQAKSMFISNMSHDMRTPLNGILGYADIALREKNADSMQEYIEKIKISGKFLLSLINDTLELSRIESGKMTIEPEYSDGSDLIDPVMNSLRPTAETKKISLEENDSEFRKEHFFTDRLKFQKIMLNLLSNAIKYTPEGGHVEFTACLMTSGKNESEYRFYIKDTGIGMSEEFLEHAFEPFAQEHRSETAGVDGTGLGLSIVNKIVNLSEGKISVSSEFNKGTCFTVDLILQRTDEYVTSLENNASEGNVLEGKRVLLCEDNKMNLEIATILLHEKVIIVDAAVNGRDGVDMFMAAAPGFYDVILMDIRMPVLNGYEAAMKIRSADRADASGIPIIAMSADIFEEDIAKAKQAGINDALSKPVDADKMYQIIEKNIKV